MFLDVVDTLVLRVSDICALPKLNTFFHTKLHNNDCKSESNNFGKWK